LFAIFCCVTARSIDSSVPGPNARSGPFTQTYDSSAAAIAGVFLFIQVYALNAARAQYPQFASPAVLVGTFTNIAMLYAPQFTTISAGITFALRLIQAMLTGTAIAVGVSLSIFPTNMRGVVFADMASYLTTMRELMKANMGYISSLQQGDMFTRTPTGAPERPRTVEAQTVKDLIADLTTLHGKLGVDLSFAKREVAFGRLGPDDLKEIFKKLKGLIFTIIGYSSLNDVFERTVENQGWTEVVDEKRLSEIEDESERRHAQSVRDWHEISGMLKGPFQHMTGYIDDGLAHILIVLRLMPKRKAVPDAETSGGGINPGEPGFTKFLGMKVAGFRDKKATLIKQFCESRGIELPDQLFDSPTPSQVEVPEWYSNYPRTNERQRYRRQLYVILFMDYLLESIGVKVHEFCIYVDDKFESGKLSKKHLIVPGVKRLRKTIQQLLSRKSDTYDDNQNEEGHRSGKVYLGSAYQQSRDPEHLPAETTFQRFGDRLRKIPHAFRSRESVFGFRVAIATMCLAIIGLMRGPRDFYMVHRLFWAQTIVSISMSPSAAQSLFGFALRILGTIIAMCSAMIIWYIVKGNFAGVIVFYWFFLLWGFFVILKFPKFSPVGMIYSITNTLIIGYELQAQIAGRAKTEASGQPFYATNILGPYRLATVCGGLLVAWFWTVFPFPLAEHSELRRDLGSALYLLANYNSVMDETVNARIRGDIDTSDPDSPYAKLQKARNKIYAKSMLTLQTLRNHVQFLRYDVPIGGRFPEDTYVRIINRVQNIFNFIALVVHASQTFADMCQNETMQDPKRHKHSESDWLRDFRRLVTDANVSTRECTTLLALLSASVTSGNPLPPYLRAPQAYALAARLDSMDRDILSIKHVAEPGFAAFACMQIGTKCIEDDIRALLRDVKTLVEKWILVFKP